MRGATLLASLLPLAWAVVAPAADKPAASQTVSVAGSQPAAKGPAEYFTGNARVEPLFAAKDTAPFSGAYVTFEPGARSAWHTHPAGQHLIVTSGVGLTQAWAGRSPRSAPVTSSGVRPASSTGTAPRRRPR
jgi:hypothetical protein